MSSKVRISLIGALTIDGYTCTHIAAAQITEKVRRLFNVRSLLPLRYIAWYDMLTQESDFMSERRDSSCQTGVHCKTSK